MIQASLFFAAFIGLLLGFFVFVNNPRATLFRLYFAFSVTSSAWIAVNGFVTGGILTLQGSSLLFVGRLITPFSLLASLSFLFFLDYFTAHRIRRISKVLAALVVAVAAFSFSSLNVYLNNTGGLSLGGLYPFYLAVVLLDVALIARALYQPAASNRGKSYSKEQLAYLRTGSALALTPTVALGAILPLVSSSRASDLAPLFFLVFLVFAGIAIVKHRLFDLRIVAARSFGYVLSLASLAIIFTLGAFSITNVFFSGKSIPEVTLRWLYASLAVILAVIFPPLQQFFNKITGRLFFRDTYDTQAFLDEFNKTLVSTYDLDQLLKQTVQTITENIKPTFCIFVINKTDQLEGRLAGALSRVSITDEDLGVIREASVKTGKKLVMTDDLEAAHPSLQKQLRSKDIVIIATLSPGASGSKASVGYLLLGPKKSGNLYSTQDTKVIEIVANELVIAVQNALRFEEIKHFNLTLQARVEEATKKLRRANEKLRQLDETKDDFISMASHQLRTPLTSVKGYISMVLEGDGGKISHKQREMLGQAFFSSQRMVYLIADLLNVSRLKTGKFIIESTPVNLASMVKEELSQLQETAASRPLTLTYDQPKKFPDLMLDDTKTRQVIMNFVDNAIYYTPPGGHINVRLIETKTSIELRVEDDGIGVPKSEQPHLFTKFYRAGNARKARPDGTGLGLFMAKKVVLAQGGSLIFESQEGKGSTFGFIFGKSKLAPAK